MKLYEKPAFALCEGAIVPEKLWGNNPASKWCFGCTNCNCN